MGVEVSHKRAPLSILDAVTLRNTSSFYQIINKIAGVRGSLILQTCNRVDLYLDIDDTSEPVERVLWHWALATRFKLGEIKRLVETKQGDEVVDHLVRLGSGLESMLVGETQILGQMKTALAEARSLKTATPVLLDVFERAVSAAAKVREQTGIGKGTVSLGSAALRLAEETLGKLDSRRVLLIGTGQVGMLVMKALKARGVTDVQVASRTRQRAESFTEAYGGTPIGLEEARNKLSTSDLVITATKAGAPLLTKEMVALAIKPSGKLLMLLDLSNPRNISPEVGELDSVVLRTIDDFRGVTDEVIARRRALVKIAEPLVKEKAQAIVSMLRREKAEPIISGIYRRADEIRAEEMNKALAKLRLTPDQEAVLKHMSQSIIEKLLDPPISNLRRAAEKGDRQTLSLASQLFKGDGSH